MPKRRKTLDEKQLTAKIDETIVNLFGEDWRAKEGCTPNTVADHVEATYPALYNGLAKQWARKYLVERCSARLREGSALLQLAASRTLLLPGIKLSIQAAVPPLITIPTAGRANRHKPVSHASLGELRAYVKALKKQMDDDSVRYKACNFIVKRCDGLPDDMLVSEACRRAAKAALPDPEPVS